MLLLLLEGGVVVFNSDALAPYLAHIYRRQFIQAGEVYGQGDLVLVGFCVGR